MQNKISFKEELYVTAVQNKSDYMSSRGAISGILVELIFLRTFFFEEKKIFIFKLYLDICNKNCKNNSK